MLLCESKIINKNPKYRIIKYNDEYLMVDIISTWISLFFPFINWFIPKRLLKNVKTRDLSHINNPSIVHVRTNLSFLDSNINLN
nr:DUF443 family protein [Staphylococcus aureus]